MQTSSRLKRFIDKIYGNCNLYYSIYLIKFTGMVEFTILPAPVFSCSSLSSSKIQSVGPLNYLKWAHKINRSNTHELVFITMTLILYKN